MKSVSDVKLYFSITCTKFISFKSLIITCDFIRIKYTSVYVNDQYKALKFHAETLGFVKRLIKQPGNTGG